MNLVGKIFTVLIFFMAVVFATFALMVNAAHKNWRAEAIKGNDDLTKAKKEIAAVTEEKKNLETALNDEKERMKRRLVALEQEIKIITAERDAKEKTLLEAESKVRDLALGIKQTNENNGVLQATIDGLNKDLKVANDDRIGLQKKLVDLNDQVLIAVAERQRLEKLQRTLADQITKMRELIPTTALNGANNQIIVVGEVTAVPDPNLVEISVGADDGVRVGNFFNVTRPSAAKYIGVIKVIRVDLPTELFAVLKEHCKPIKFRRATVLSRKPKADKPAKPAKAAKPIKPAKPAKPAKAVAPQEYRKPRADVYTVLLSVALIMIVTATVALWMLMKNDYNNETKGGPNESHLAPAGDRNDSRSSKRNSLTG